MEQREVSLKLIRDLNVRCKIMTLLKYVIWGNIHSSEYWDTFIDTTPRIHDFRYIPRGGIWGHRGVLYLTYERIPYSFPNLATISVGYYINISGGYK
jgi:hypothetical protein